MRSQSFSHRFALASVLCTLAVTVMNCSDNSTTSPGGAGSAGDADNGDAGSPSAAAGQSSVLVCGQPTDFSQCDPRTGSACDLAAGETCDHSAPLGGFKCFPGPNSAGPGEFCDNETVFCAATTACNVELSQCEHYCCVDSDCAHGFCTPDQFVDGKAAIGFCTGEYAGVSDGGAGGTGG